MNTKTQRNIQIVDLQAQFISIKEELEKSVLDSLNSGSYILGPNVKVFEEELAQYHQCKHVISCANGTDALVIALMATNIKTGDEVITVSNSYFATAEAIATVGATPVFIDANEDDFNIDVNKIEKAITKNTKAIMPVHLYGQPCDIDKILEIAKKYNLKVIEDTAQAIGAKFKNQFAGTFGDIGTTSFYPTKNLGACGDGGAIFTNDTSLAEKITLLRQHGSPGRYIHDLIGMNSRLDEIQAAILRVKLKYLNKWNEARYKAAMNYENLLQNIDGLKTPKIKPGCTHVFHQYTIMLSSEEKRNFLYEKLKERGITTIIYYPIPIHKQKAFSYLEIKNPLPITEKLSKQILSLPMYAEITEDDQKYITENVRELLV